MSGPRLTRREALLGALALAAAGCGGATGSSGVSGGLGSTLTGTWSDPDGTGLLRLGPGERLVARLELGRARRARAAPVTFVHLTDAHVLDPSSPARVPFLDRLGSPFQSTFRPQETLTAQVLAGAARSVRALRPHAVIQGGDLIDNDQANELARALAVLHGGRVGAMPYDGVQLASDPDPFYYRPDVDAPRHPGLLRAAGAAFVSPGVGRPLYPVLGDHDILVAGELPPDPTTMALAVGEEALWELPPGLSLPSGVPLTTGGSPDGPPDPGVVNGLLAQALAGPKVRVRADPGRRELPAGSVISELRRAAGLSAGAAPLDYAVDLGPDLRVIVLDLARRGGGSGGLVRPGQAAWLDAQLAAAGARWVIAVSHQPLVDSAGADALLALLDAHPRMLAALAGHTHHNRITPRPTAAGGYWLIETASLIDYPQQARALQFSVAEGGGAVLTTWMLDHTFPGSLGTISRQLAYLDAQGGRPGGFAGTRTDRNVVLYRAAA